MKIRFDAIFAGTIAVIGGIKMFYTGYVWTAPITPAASIFVCLFGVIVIIWGIFGSQIMRVDGADLMICKKCKSEYKARSVEIANCPKCNGKLEMYKKST